MAATDELLALVREVTGRLPGVTERVSHGAPCFFVGGRPLCYFHDADFSADGRAAVWCPAPPGDQQHWVQRDPLRYFAPSPSASGTFSTWVGAYLDGSGAAAPDWEELAELLETAHALRGG